MLRLLVLTTVVAVALGCQGGADCGDDECCVITPHGNQCQPMAKTSEDCVIMFGTFPMGKPEGPVDQCPCSMGLTCVLGHGVEYGEGAKGSCKLLMVS